MIRLLAPNLRGADDKNVTAMLFSAPALAASACFRGRLHARNPMAAFGYKNSSNGGNKTMTKLTHNRHKTDPFRYLYRDEDRLLQKAPLGFGSSEDWEVIDEIQSYEQIPEKYRSAVEEWGYRIYWQFVAPANIVDELPMTADQAAKLRQLAEDANNPSAFATNLTQAEAQRRIAVLGAKLLRRD